MNLKTSLYTFFWLRKLISTTVHITKGISLLSFTNYLRQMKLILSPIHTSDYLFQCLLLYNIRINGLMRLRTLLHPGCILSPVQEIECSIVHFEFRSNCRQVTEMHHLTKFPSDKRRSVCPHVSLATRKGMLCNRSSDLWCSLMKFWLQLKYRGHSAMHRL
jgi:hypothetical protein